MTPKLISLVDVLFVLLVFLMLGNDMRPRDREEVRLPKAWSLNDCTKGLRQDRVIVNAWHATEHECGHYRRGTLCRNDSHWRLNVLGEDCTDTRVLCRMLESKKGRVVLRADAGTPYGLVQRALMSCSEEGIASIQVSAVRPPWPR